MRKIMEMNHKIKVFMKVGTDDEIDEKDVDVSSDHALASFMHVKNAIMISMHKTCRWGLFSLTQRKNDCSRKNETMGAYTYPPSE